jgi:hypothetical protein
MLGSYRVYDADAHVILAPAMWQDLPNKYVPRRPRPATFSDSGDMAAYTSGWLIEGRVEPHILGPGLQPANPPAWVVEGRHRDTHTLPTVRPREDAAQNLLQRRDVTEIQKQKILYDNPVRFFGEP